MSVLLGHDPGSDAHDPGPGHPERAERVAAALRGAERAGLEESLVSFVPRAATDDELERVHEPRYVKELDERCARGGGSLDSDTVITGHSCSVARRAAGAGIDAVERLEAGEADAAFLALRPPGHHARPGAAMGFCLFNNVAVTAAALVERGERVLVLDWDAHHGNGTQEAFYGSAEVLFVSLHQYPWYPGTGALEETGTGPGAGYTINIPLPASTAGDAYRLAFEELVVPAAEQFSPTWLLVSAGFDSHRADPLAELGLSAGDFGDLAERAVRLVPPGRRVVFLEGGYDLEAVEVSVAATVAALGGVTLRPERETSGGRDGLHGAAPSGRPARAVAAARALHESLVTR